MSTATGPLTREAFGVVILSVMVVLGITLLASFKDIGFGGNDPTLNNQINKYISGLGIFGDFIGIIVITVIVVGLLLLLILAIRKLRKGM